VLVACIIWLCNRILWNLRSITHISNRSVLCKFGNDALNLVLASSKKSQSYLTTDGQSASLSWYQATICDLLQIFLSLPQTLSTDICGLLLWCALSDERPDL
jgi:hypothetical protein